MIPESDYGKMFEPFQREGYPLATVVTWLEDTTKADRDIIDQTVSETMGMVAQGEKFELPCKCGCGMEYTDAPISHFMLARAFALKEEISSSRIKILQQAENVKLEARQKRLSNFDKEYNKMVNGTHWQRFKKFVGLQYDQWEKE